jgi:hypothetical protein
MSVLADGPIFDSPSEKPARYWTYEGGREVKVMLPAEPPRRARAVGLCALDALRNLLPERIIEDRGRRGVKVVWG